MRGYARILLLGLTLTASAADEIEFEIVPAIVTAPLEPVAGAPLTVRLAPDLIGRGRSLRLVNADTGLAVAEQRIAGDAIDRYTFQLPDDLERPNDGRNRFVWTNFREEIDFFDECPRQFRKKNRKKKQKC